MSRPVLMAVLASMLSLVLAATAANAALVEDSTRLFLNRGADCGTKFLAPTPGAGGGCGDRGLNEVFIQATGEEFFVYESTTTAGVPLILDAARELKGQINVRPDGVGTGVVEVDLTLTATVPNSFQTLTLGTATMTDDDLANVSGDRLLSFTIDLDESLQEVEVSSITIELVVHGSNVNHGFVQHDDSSWFRVPTLVDDGS